MNKLKWNAGQIVNDTSVYELAEYPATDKPKYLVDYDFKDMEIARLNKIIEEIETIFDTPYFDEEVSKQLGDNGFFTFKQMYEACSIVFKKRLQELKEEGN